MVENTLTPIERQAQTVSRVAADNCVTLPPNISEILKRDPRLIGFIAARHKFVAKILEGKNVLEIGCQEGFGTLFVAPYVKSITAIDFYEPFIDGFAKHTAPHAPNCRAYLHDITKSAVQNSFEGAFALDVLEHIDPNLEPEFWNNVSLSVTQDATVIVGMPSLESQAYASEASRVGHVNCKTGQELRTNALRYFTNVFLFSMNDEMLHIGFPQMSHYIFAVCVNRKI
jgi:2-polyprenyl-3-methyl-5-hydroxy-6-metoxy-1,4-benzoquinol methylase